MAKLLQPSSEFYKYSESKFQAQIFNQIFSGSKSF